LHSALHTIPVKGKLKPVRIILETSFSFIKKKDILNESTPGIYSFYVKVPKTGERNVEVTVGLRKGHDLAV
jgi:hypothetical protein